MWPFECIGPDGQTYLHNDNWKSFVEERATEYPHDWNHRRSLLTLCFPRDNFKDVPGVTDATVINLKEEGFSTIFQPYPAHHRSGFDPEGKEPSYNLFVEDGHVAPLGDPIVLFSTGCFFFPVDSILGHYRPERFAFFKGKYWRVWAVQGGGIGVAEPPPPPQPVPKPVRQFRSLDDDWQ